MTPKRSYNLLLVNIAVTYFLLDVELVLTGLGFETFPLGWMIVAMVVNLVFIKFIVNLISVNLVAKIENLTIELYAKAKSRIKWTAMITTVVFADVYFNTFNENAKLKDYIMIGFSTWMMFGLGYRLWQLITGDFVGGDKAKFNNNMLKMTKNIFK
ncbi:hypothetical protein [Mucilaginibacter flavidus]|uniref:hypothetical protein n=1 Tax=Mucilaginibacter flavidus TaxID=2949309 RepID=UPI002093B39C|nr:hypothetical protein [Mucilaginibacter flavidus]MCO5945340.1 hypothetical protein [Mucilaginibacter flavidus]